MWKTCVTLALLMCIQVCAHGPMHRRVPGGVDAQEGAWPWIVSLHDPTCHSCGGSLISNRWVLSAAHCFIGTDYSVDESSICVYLGKMTQHGKNKNEIVRFVERIFVHSKYNITTGDNDIALLHLSSDVTFNKYISPVCLIAHGSDFPDGTSSWIIGWGEIASGVNLHYPGNLQEAEVFVVNKTQCQTQLMQRKCSGQVTDNMICAGVPAGGRDTGHGDSGGPMMSQHCSKWVQFGITSWGYDCGLPDTPGVYTRVSRYQQWITDTITSHTNNDFPQFVNLSVPCSSPQPKKGWCCCL